MIKAIIFDMGGVIVDLDLQRSIDAFREKAGFEEIDQFLDAYHQRGPFRELEGGTKTEKDFLSEVLPYCKPGTTAKTIRDCFWEIVDGIEEYKIPLIQELSEKYTLAVLSNNNPIVVRRATRRYFNETNHLRTAFKYLFYSYRMKLLKPNADIFEKAIKTMGIRPEEALFIDDSKRNTDAAEALGINTLLYVQGTDLRAAIETRLRELC